MRKTFQKILSKSLIAIFIFSFGAGQVLAQTNWTPPTGPATGNNVPPPLNVGGGDNTGVAGDQSYAQHKEGDLYLESDLILDGTTDSNSVFSSWITSFFGDDVLIGSPLAGGGNQGPFPLLFLNGTFRYSPKAAGTGAIAPLTPEELADGGYENVLIGDAQGNVRWTDAANVGGAGGSNIPDGNNNGDILIWNGTTWVAVANTFGTDLPDGTNQNDILVWDTATQTWIVGPYPTGGGGGNLPAGTQGQTLWYNGGTWQATNRIKYTQDIFPPGSHLLHIGDTASAGDVVIEDGVVAVKGNNVSINDGANYTTAVTTIKGNSLVLDSENVGITNISSNPLAGRFLFSKDDNGKVEWNKNLVYARNTFFGDSFYDTVSVINDPDLTAGQNGYIGTFFVNEGATYLKGNAAIDGETRINNKLIVNEGGDIELKDIGDLYLEGIDYPPATYWQETTDSHGNPVSSAVTNKLKQLCIDTENFKVVYCDSPDPKPAATHEYVTVTCTPAGCDHNITLPYEFDTDAMLDIEYCGAGGGGGGGGKGLDIPSYYPEFLVNLLQDMDAGAGGGGGGGGSAGECNTYSDIEVGSGDEIDATIGAGGNGGSGAKKSDLFNITPTLVFSPVLALIYQNFLALPNDSDTQLIFQNLENTNYNNPATDGGEGAPTNVFLTGYTYPQAEGGQGGWPGGDAAGAGGGAAGQGSNSLITSSWHDGVSGSSPLPPYGGQGGDGESPEVIANNGATIATGGSGGAGATDDSEGGIAHNGSAGKLASGGGGGSGGFGDSYEQFGCGQGPAFDQGEPNITIPGTNIPAPGAQLAPADLYHNLCRILKGGNGGKGGDGYLKIHNFPIQIAPPPSEIVYAAPGGYTLEWNAIPSGITEITVKVWGAGGGGGRAKENTNTATEDILAGGGGAGGYVEAVIPRQPSGSTPIQITIGAGGDAGAVGAANAGGNGGQSKVDVTITGVNDVIANGGQGGGGDVENSPGGAGGAGGTASGGINDTGPNGENGSSGGQGGDQDGPANFADGGIGGIVNNIAGANLSDRNPTAGKPGRVEITW